MTPQARESAIRQMHERAIDEVAEMLHDRLCGCAAGEADSRGSAWCDSIYPVTAERAILHYQQTMARVP